MAVTTASQPVVGAYGDAYTAPVGTPYPTDLDKDPAVPASPWTRLGMISEDGATWTPPAEETSDIKIWQSPYPARTVTTGLTSSVSFALDQWDRNTLPFALGGGTFDDTTTPGTVVYKPPGPGESVDKALFIKVVDGDVLMGIYFPKGRVISRDDTTMKPDEPMLLNVEFGLLVVPDTDPYNLIFDAATFPGGGGGVAATGATEVSGVAGTWTPSGATAPADLAAMTGITASPASGWNAASYMTMGDGNKTHWNDTAWVAFP